MFVFLWFFVLVEECCGYIIFGWNDGVVGVCIVWVVWVIVIWIVWVNIVRVFWLRIGRGWVCWSWGGVVSCGGCVFMLSSSVVEGVGVFMLGSCVRVVRRRVGKVFYFGGVIIIKFGGEGVFGDGVLVRGGRVGVVGIFGYFEGCLGVWNRGMWFCKVLVLDWKSVNDELEWENWVFFRLDLLFFYM